MKKREESLQKLWKIIKQYSHYRISTGKKKEKEKLYLKQ